MESILDEDMLNNTTSFKSSKKKRRRKKKSSSKQVVHKDTPKNNTDTITMQREKLIPGRPAAVLNKKIKTIETDSSITALIEALGPNAHSMTLDIFEKIVKFFKSVFTKTTSIPDIPKEHPDTFDPIMKVIDKVLGTERTQSYDKIFAFAFNTFMLYHSSMNPKQEGLRSAVQQEFGTPQSR